MNFATYNVHFAKDPMAIVDTFRTYEQLRNADVICLQEIEHEPTEALSRTHRIAEGLGFNYSFARSRNTTHGPHGIATLSREPFQENVIVQLPGAHTITRSHPRIALLSRIASGKEVVTVCNVHLDPRLSETQRQEQLYVALEKISGPAVIAGDFNTFPFRVMARVLPIAFRDQKKYFDEYMARHGFPYHCQIPQYTMKKGALTMKLDDIYSNTPIIASGVIMESTASDHKPVWARIDL